LRVERMVGAAARFLQFSEVVAVRVECEVCAARGDERGEGQGQVRVEGEVRVR
jgi:hypothetical protein